ncbi:MAG: hypothetical protein RLT87_07400 [Gammaproteobacteria bacterium]
MRCKFSRKELYDLVWTKPLRDLSSEIGVSDTAIRKNCKKSGIPLPGIGYWNKKYAGKKVIKAELTPRFPGASDVIHIGGDQYSYDRSIDLLNEPLPSPPEFDESLQSVRDRIVKMVGKVVCSSTLNRVHPIIQKLLNQDEERRKEYLDRGYSWNKPIFDTPIQKRRLRILNTIFLSTQDLGCKASMTTSKYSDDNRDAHISVGEYSVGFTLKESDIRQQNSKKITERLCLTIQSQSEDITTEWFDATNRKIEKLLTDIVIEILLTGEIHYRESAIRSYEWKVKRKQELEEEERQRILDEEHKAKQLREKQEKERIDNLLYQAKALQDAETIRLFVENIRKNSSKIDVENSDIERWAKWALEQADSIDPLNNPEFLKYDDCNDIK